MVPSSWRPTGILVYSTDRLCLAALTALRGPLADGMPPAGILVYATERLWSFVWLHLPLLGERLLTICLSDAEAVVVVSEDADRFWGPLRMSMRQSVF